MCETKYCHFSVLMKTEKKFLLKTFTVGPGAKVLNVTCRQKYREMRHHITISLFPLKFLWNFIVYMMSEKAHCHILVQKFHNNLSCSTYHKKSFLTYEQLIKILKNSIT
jgi:hypothetical protein